METLGDILRWLATGLFWACAAVLGLIVLLVLLARSLGWRDPRPRERRRARKGLGLGIEELARRLAMEPDALRSFEPHYRPVLIAKRRGGQRRLLVPSVATKALQRRILGRLLARLRAHEAACGFERGKSIVHNALPHVGRAVVIRLDVVDFFPSTDAERLDAYFRRVGWDAECAALLVKLTTHDGGLPQGAPTSPRLSNLVNFHLDAQLTKLAERRYGTYTRYADDLTFSFTRDYPRKMRGIVQRARWILRKNGYTMHERKKLSIRRAHQRQKVTGLVVNARVQLPRATRRWLRAVRHRAARGGEATLRPEQIEGWAALEGMIRRQARGSTPSQLRGPDTLDA